MYKFDFTFRRRFTGFFFKNLHPARSHGDWLKIQNFPVLHSNLEAKPVSAVHASGRMYRTDWFRFQIRVKNGKVLYLEPITMAARRVQILEEETCEPATEREIELVHDVTGADPNAEKAFAADASN